ncbi:MAG: zinc-dependent alcohol dehydrogenase family protein [Chromatiales bacterium]|nr:zinc-dependent alcohol dehydrogenase family protein [Chromatiales bacterium]
MRCIQMTAAGEPEVLQPAELEAPVLPADSLRVALHGAGVNPVDTKLRARGLYGPAPLPAILGCDGAGEVLKRGSSVTGFSTGTRVWYCYGGIGVTPGNYAEQNVVPAIACARAPRTLDLTLAAAGPLVLITAWEALYDRARLTAGQTLLIHAAAGGVGHVAVQLAKLRGARVIATVSTAEKDAFVRALGADEVVRYTQTNVVEATRSLTAGRGADVVFDTIGGKVFLQSLEACAPYGDVVTILEPPPEVSWKAVRPKNLRIGFELMLTPMMTNDPAGLARHAAILQRCAEWIDMGQLRIEVEAVLPLRDAAEAHRRVESGHTRGKIVLDTRAAG